MSRTKARDRRVIRREVRRDHPKRNVLTAAPLDRARRPLTDRVGVDGQRDHHLRIERRATPTVRSISREERRQVHRVDGVQHEPGEVLGRQPIPQARRQQQLLLAITRDEVLPHPAMLLNPPDGTRFMRQTQAKRNRRPLAGQ